MEDIKKNRFTYNSTLGLKVLKTSDDKSSSEEKEVADKQNKITKGDYTKWL